MVAAVEVYNKPAFAYREETFALLMINAWELLLKAKLLKDGGNKSNCIRDHERRRNANGTLSKKLYLKRNRANNPMTIGLPACIKQLDTDANSRLSPAIKANIDALMEIRDNAAHYIHASSVLSRQVLEIGSAAIKNFILLATRWFERDLSGSLSLVLPLSFISGNREIDAVSVSSDERNLIDYLRQLAQSDAASDDTFSVAVRLDVKLERSRLDTATRVIVTNDIGAMPLTLREEDIREKYPWDYKELTNRLAKRYSDFKLNPAFHAVRKPLLSNPAYVNSRFLDPGNPKSSKKDFYNSNVLQVFDQHYSKR